jgi:hypothetical protein
MASTTVGSRDKPFNPLDSPEQLPSIAGGWHAWVVSAKTSEYCWDPKSPSAADLFGLTKREDEACYRQRWPNRGLHAWSVRLTKPSTIERDPPEAASATVAAIPSGNM